MEDALSSLTGKMIHNRELSFKHIEYTEESPVDCEVLFISAEHDYEAINFGELHENGILTIGDSPGFLASGGCIRLKRVGKKIKFSINTEAIEKANVRPSSKILSLAVGPDK